MINQFEAPMYLEQALPEITGNMTTDRKNNMYKLLNALIQFTSENVQVHNFTVVKRCFRVADKLYNKGNTVVKDAVENVFVYSFSKMLYAYPDEKKRLLAIIPITLYTLYIRQVYHSGC